MKARPILGRGLNRLLAFLALKGLSLALKGLSIRRRVVARTLWPVATEDRACSSLGSALAFDPSPD